MLLLVQKNKKMIKNIFIELINFRNYLPSTLKLYYYKKYFNTLKVGHLSTNSLASIKK